jgi:hypothetical protein
MIKHKLDIVYDYGFFVLAIATHEPDYRLCIAINNVLGIELERETSVEFKNTKQEENLLFSLFTYFNEEEQLQYDLVANKSYNTSVTIKKDETQPDLFGSSEVQSLGKKGYLVPELANADFLFIIRMDYDPDIAEEIERDLYSIDFILNIQLLDGESINAKKNLIF